MLECVVRSCCCGLQELQPGVFNLAIFCLVLNLLLVAAPEFILMPGLSEDGYQGKPNKDSVMSGSSFIEESSLMSLWKKKGC